MVRLLAEWEQQDFILVSFPTNKTDWRCCLNEAIQTYKNIINTISKYQKIVILTHNLQETKQLFKNHKNKIFIKLDYNDTWVRDYGAISVLVKDKLKVLDFVFNGWGNKFDASKDNQVNQKLKLKGIYKNYLFEKINFVLEGGSIDNNSDGILLTTTKCLLNINRNKNMKKSDIEKRLYQYFGVKKILWLENGYLSGDDTDSHIDTLARFVDKNTIVYQSAYEDDINYQQLIKMELELKKFTSLKNQKFQLVKLPPITPKYHNNKQLPATYANFLIINNAVLVPIYQDKNDQKALNIFKKLFLKKDIIGIDCSTLIKQHGSLHCATMQFYHSIQNNNF